MSLTDDWKEGKLQSGFYYVKDRFNKNHLIGAYSHYNKDHYFFNNYGGTITVKEVISKVPSYEELQELKHFDGKNVCAENEVLRLKVAKLEEKLNNFKAKGNYPDRISKLKAKIKHLLDLQANQDKEVETLRDLLKICRDILEVEGFYPTVCEINTAIGESEE